MLTNAMETSSSIANFYLHKIVQIQCGTIISLFQTFLITNSECCNKKAVCKLSTHTLKLRLRTVVNILLVHNF